MRRKLFAANWKMHKTRAETRAFLAAFLAASKPKQDVEVVVFPPFTSLAVLQEEGKGLHYGAQDAHWEEKGAFTGEVSLGMLQDLGCKYLLIGHSERRQMFGETDEGCRKKIEAALKARIKPMVCVGETLQERDAHGHFAKVAKQVRAAAGGLKEGEAAELCFAYEPIWAIGTGRNATELQAQEMCAHLRKILREEVGSVADRVQVLYGGSVKADNIGPIARQADVDGALIGGASMDPKGFLSIIENGVKS